MLMKPRLKYCYSVEFLDNEHTLLISENDHVILTEGRFQYLLPEIQHEGLLLEEIFERLDRKVSQLEIVYMLDILEKAGYLTEADTSLPQETRAYWNSLGIEINGLQSALGEKQISVEVMGRVPPDTFMQAFEATGIRVGPAGEIKVILTDHYHHPGFRQINRDALKTGRPWMPVKPVGLELWLGPIFQPGKTGCWECLRHRLEINFPINTLYKTQRKTTQNLRIPPAYIPPSIQIAAGMTAVEIARWLYAGKNENLEGKLISYKADNQSIQTHILVKRPQCRACGEPGHQTKPAPIILKRETGPCLDTLGGYREVSPEETLENYSHHISPITGVVQKLRPYHRIGGTPVYNYSSGLNTALRSKTLFWLNQHIRSGNGGKGKTRTQAKAGALCEAIERYSLVYHGDEPVITAAMTQLGDDAIHPNACMNFSDAQYRGRNKINLECAKFYELVPVPFEPGLKMDWTPVYSLTEEKFKYLPSCFCYAQYPAKDEMNLYAYPDSNGCAAGNSPQEAILQGFLELVERDSAALWWYNMLPRPGVDLDSFNNPYFTRLTRYYQSINRGLRVLDLTADLQIPVFAAVSYRRDNPPENIIFGFGAHVEAGIAIERALIELNQLLPIVNVPGQQRARGEYLTRDKNFVHWLNTAAMENHPYLAPQENLPLKRAADYPPLCEPFIYDSILYCIERAAQKGLETLVLDLTRPDTGLPVAKVIVPGLRHFWKRLAPGRLYEVPVKMGWRKKQAREVELNPVGLFI